MIYEILEKAINMWASDIILATWNIPAVKLCGEIVYFNECEVLDWSLQKEIEPLMNEEQKKYFLSHGEIDFSYEKKNIGRFRVNIFSQSKWLSIVFRVIWATIPTLEDISNASLKVDLEYPCEPESSIQRS